MIEPIFLDIDGCLTDSKIIYTQNDGGVKEFDVKDGAAIEAWLKFGRKVVIITGCSSPCVEQRAKDLKAEFVFQGIKDKLSCVRELLVKLSLGSSQCAAIGDYHSGKALFEAAKLSFRPKDAHRNLKVDIKLKKKGGRDAVAQMIELIIERNVMQKEWDAL